MPTATAGLDVGLLQPAADEKQRAAWVHAEMVVEVRAHPSTSVPLYSGMGRK